MVSSSAFVCGTCAQEMDMTHDVHNSDEYDTFQKLAIVGHV